MYELHCGVQGGPYKHRFGVNRKCSNRMGKCEKQIFFALSIPNVLALSPILELLRNGGVCWHDVGILFRSPMHRVGNIDCIKNLVSKIQFSVSLHGNVFVPICTATRDGYRQLIFSTGPRITILLYN